MPAQCPVGWVRPVRHDLVMPQGPSLDVHPLSRASYLNNI